MLIADYSLTYANTNIVEVKNNVSITNYGDVSKLITDHLFCDANEHYIYTEKKFTFITDINAIHCVRLKLNEDLSKVNMKSIQGSVYVKGST